MFTRTAKGTKDRLALNIKESIPQNASLNLRDVFSLLTAAKYTCFFISIFNGKIFTPNSFHTYCSTFSIYVLWSLLAGNN